MFEVGYSKLEADFPQVQFVRESNFASQVTAAIASSGDFLLFGVDDALFCNTIPLGSAVAALREDPLLSCVHLKLSPGLSFSHPAGKVQRQPNMEELGEELAVFAGGEGSLDWNYPFELCGTLYRGTLVREILRLLEVCDETAGGLSHPNRLEVAGNRVFKSALGDAAEGERRACLQRRAMVVVTINRVQNLFSNPVFIQDAAERGGEGPLEGSSEWSVTALDRLLSEGRHLDHQRYLTACTGAVHVGGLFLLPKDPIPPLQQSLEATPRVSVVIPVHNGMPHLTRALHSLRTQSLRDFEVVMVDDSSTDNSLCEMKRWGAKDRRFRLLALTHRVGVARALSAGVNMARAPLLARLDADDTSHPDRLRRQALFLDHHPRIAAVGAAVSIAYLTSVSIHFL